MYTHKKNDFENLIIRCHANYQNQTKEPFERAMTVGNVWILVVNIGLNNCKTIN
jgi:hypothetical protein